MSDIQDDIGADVAAAFASFEPAGSEAPAAEAPAAPEAAPLPVDGPQRDEHGRFSPKAGEAPAQQPVAKTPEGAQAPVTPVPGEAAEVPKTFIPPRVWSPEQKSQFASLPTWAQEAIAGREVHGEQGVAKLNQQLEAFQPIEALLAPHRERWQMAGMSAPQAVESLLAAQSYLERDAPAAIAYLAKIYGVPLQGGVPTGTPQGHQAQTAPEVLALQREMQDLKQAYAQQTQSVQEQQRADITSQITAFSTDPANLYFHEVKGEMAALMQAGRAPDLATAYEMATWARADIRKLILADQTRASAAQEQERQRQTAAAARQAAGSITGDSLGGHKPTLPGSSSSSIEDDVRAAFDRAAGVV